MYFVVVIINSDIQISSLSSSSNDQSSLMEETPRPSLEPFQQPSLSTPNIQSPRTSSVQGISTNIIELHYFWCHHFRRVSYWFIS